MVNRPLYEGVGPLPALFLDRGQPPPTTACLWLGGSKERNMKPPASKLIRWAGLAAMAAGIIFVGIQPIHPLDVLSSVTTTQWVVIQSLKTAMCLLGLLG